jgi:hypothetical protein
VHKIVRRVMAGLVPGPASTSAKAVLGEPNPVRNGCITVEHPPSRYLGGAELLEPHAFTSLPRQDHAAFTSIRRIARCASAGFGIRIVSTPLS